MTDTPQACRIVRYTPGGSRRYMAADGHSTSERSDAATFPDVPSAHEGANAAGWIRGAYSVETPAVFAEIVTAR